MTADPSVQTELRASTGWRWALGVAIAALLMSGGLAARQYFRFSAAAAQVDHAYQVLTTIDEVLATLLDAETGARGYLLTGNTTFLAPYETAGPRLDSAAKELASLVRDNQLQSERASRLSSVSLNRLAELTTAVDAFRDGREAAARARIQSGAGSRLMQEARTDAARMKAAETSLLDGRSLEVRLARRAALAYAIVCLIVAGVVGLVAVAVDRDYDRRRKALGREMQRRESAEHSALAAGEELRRSEGLNRSILESSGDGIQVLTLDGHIESMNAAGLRLFGIDDVVTVKGRPFVDLWPGNTDLARSALAAAAFSGEGRFQALSHADGTSKWWDVIVTPIKDDDGRATRLVCIARDVTERKQAEEERERLLASERAARSEAERAAHMKDEFLATLSHELRTPLNAIVGWVGVLKQDHGAETMAKAIDVIDRNSRRQSQMIEDLLDVSRIVSGKLPLDVQRVDLASVIDEAVSSAQPAADARGVRLVKTLGSAAIIQGDPVRLQQVVWNLLSNAIKFTNRGGRVQITLRKVQSSVAIEVSDTGQGIDPEVLPQVFQRFRQADSSSTRKHAGLGLGLAIVKSIVEMHGGTVAAASDGVNRGAVFTVTLPLSLMKAVPRATDGDHAGAPAHGRIPLTGIVVLVLDDEPDARELLQRLLEDAGAQVSSCADVEHALDLIRHGIVPDVIVSDVGMPERDGYDFIQHVRQMTGPVAAVPAAALTALARVEDRRRALLAGFQTHLAKPVDPEELLATVASLARRTGRVH